MKHPLTIRLLTLGLLTLLLLIPLLMVRDVISERAAYRHQAAADIARSWGGRQALTGPVLVQTWQTVEIVKVWDAEAKVYVDEHEPRHHRRVTFPEALRIAGNLQVEERYRGIHAVPVYRADLAISGRFELPALPDGARDAQHILILGLSDPRGLRAQPAMTWDGQALTVQPGTGTALGAGLQAELSPTSAGTGAFHISVAVGGSQGFDATPVGGGTEISLRSNWPHPRFTGGYLPDTRRIGADGFEAAWRTSRFAATARETLSACLHEAACHVGPLEMVSVDLTDPVDIYALNDRSTKYALLFVAVVFGVFFVFEALKRLRIHPVQYTLVGLAQALFFLLLLSLSEHVAFGWAYLAGALLCGGLLTFYVTYVLGSLRRAGGFALLLAGIYGALYVILLSEDYALLTGSALLLVILAGAMILTRHVDWYAAEGARA